MYGQLPVFSRDVLCVISVSVPPYCHFNDPQATALRGCPAPCVELSVDAWQRDRDGLTAGEVDEGSGVADGPAPEKIEQQRESMAYDHTDDEQGLAFKRLGDRAGWGIVVRHAVVGKFREIASPCRVMAIIRTVTVAVPDPLAAPAG